METSSARNLMPDEEWVFFEWLILSVRAPYERKPTKHRLVLDGIFRIACTGVSWRDLTKEFGKWSSVYRQFRLWEQIMGVLNESGTVPDLLRFEKSGPTVAVSFSTALRQANLQPFADRFCRELQPLGNNAYLFSESNIEFGSNNDLRGVQVGAGEELKLGASQASGSLAAGAVRAQYSRLPLTGPRADWTAFFFRSVQLENPLVEKIKECFASAA